MPTANTPGSTPARPRPIPASLPVAPRDPEDEVRRVRDLVAQLADQGVRADALADTALDHLELGDPTQAAETAQTAREQALAAGDFGTLALATAILAAVRTTEGRSTEAAALCTDAEKFLGCAGVHTQEGITRRILETISR